MQFIDIASLFIIAMTFGVLLVLIYRHFRNPDEVTLIFLIGGEREIIRVRNKGKPLVFDLDQFAKDIVKDWEEIKEEEGESWKSGEKPYGEPM